ncbi:MAG: ABC transporter ATP-binding protein/permease [Spirochaetaceae bacterium]|jgi:ATP-binding cassette subfamily B protein|nr:ABC transporter ATP-binding protein/permease [Spirochaetaceae bacterium]
MEEKKISIKEFKTLFPYLARYRTRYVLGFLCLISVDGASIAIPQFTRRAIDLVSSGSFAMRDIITLGLGMIGVMTIVCFGRFLWRYFIHGSSRRIETELRQKLFEHLLSLSYDYYQKNKIGDLMARATNDLNAVRESIGMGLVAFIDGTVMSAAILIILFMQDARSAAFALLPLPLITLIILFFGSVVGKKFMRAQQAYSSLSDTVQETFAGIRVVKSFVKEWWFIKKFADTNDDYLDANMALVKLFGFIIPLVSFLSGITSIILLLVGGIRVVEGSMSPGDLMAMFTYFQMLIWPLMGAGFVVNMIQRGAASLARVNEVMNTKPSIVSPVSSLMPKTLGHVGDNAVEIRRLSFAYTEGKPVLDDVSLSIPRGSLLGILGRTGSGKSTLIKTLTRTVDPPVGTVLVNGQNVQDWDLRELRQLFGVTPQDSYLFSDSIKGNIAYGTVSDEATLKKVAALSAIDRDLGEFAHGWDTIIGERGLTLSGGQKQRVAISRALTREPPILILDDSLSAVDAETERRILNALIQERRGKTTIIISHRVSTLRNADAVLVLDAGRVAEYGAPSVLIERGGFFAKLAALQQLDQES